MSERTAVHVLFVDDDEPNLLVWQEACRDEFPALVATSAAQAIERMRAHEVGVLLADQRMPGETGVELLERVRGEWPDTIRILVTAYSDLQAAIDAINRGEVRRYVRKPWKPEEMRAEIADALDLYGLKTRVRALERRLVATERIYALGLIVAGVSHELRTPVSVIKSNLQVVRIDIGAIERELGATGPAQNGTRRKLMELDRILDESLLLLERVAGIAKDLAAPACPDDGQPVDAAEALRLTLRIVRGEARDRDADLQIDARGVPPVRGSPTKLGQVMLNLVANALHAVKDRPRGARTVVVRLAGDGGNVIFEVADSGPGIPEAHLPRLFDPFFTTKGSEGAGLGLAISRRIVEEMGGRIEAANRPEGGARFRVTLPTVDA